MVALAIRTGIAPDVWLRQADRVIETAFDLLRPDGAQTGRDGRQMSG